MIKIADRFFPYSLLPGAKFLIPFSSFAVQVFPTALILLHENRKINLNILGPVDKFKAVLNLEKGIIEVSGRGRRGYFQYALFSKDGKLVFSQKKAESLIPELDRTVFISQKYVFETLSFGISKSADFNEMKKRRKMDELFPFWFRFGQMFPFLNQKPEGDSMLSRLNDFDSFQSLFQGGFSSVFFPEKKDENYWGYPLDPLGPLDNPILILKEGYQKIRNFLLIEDEACFILPRILSWFPQGRAIHLKTSFGSVDIEWTKNFLRKVIIYSNVSRQLRLIFPKNHKRCRINNSRNRVALDGGCLLDLEQDVEYSLTYFQE